MINKVAMVCKKMSVSFSKLWWLSTKLRIIQHNEISLFKWQYELLHISRVSNLSYPWYLSCHDQLDTVHTWPPCVWSYILHCYNYLCLNNNNISKIYKHQFQDKLISSELTVIYFVFLRFLVLVLEHQRMWVLACLKSAVGVWCRFYDTSRLKWKSSRMTSPSFFFIFHPHFCPVDTPRNPFSSNYCKVHSFNLSWDRGS